MMHLDPDQPDFDTKMLDYLSQFPLDDIDNEYIARNTMGRSRVAPNEIAGVRKIRQLKILITSAENCSNYLDSEENNFVISSKKVHVSIRAIHLI